MKLSEKEIIKQMIRKSNTILKNILIFFCPFLILLACSKDKSKIPNFLSNTKYQEDSSGNTNDQQSIQINFTGRSCDYFSDLETNNDDIEIPKSVGQCIENCHQNPNYNACIYNSNLFTRDDSLPIFEQIFKSILQLQDLINHNDRQIDPDWMQNIRNNGKNFNDAMRFYQTYAVNITGTTNNILRNEHYNVSGLRELTRVSQSKNRKWTQPYVNSIDSNYHYDVEQVMAYYYLMYQKEWMELNTGKWYASGKNISIVFSKGENSYNKSSSWSEYENSITLAITPLISNRSNTHLFPIGASMNPASILHEAGHANFDYSNPYLSREGEEDDTQVTCGLRKLYKETKSDPFLLISFIDNTCCASAEGCFKAISEGQADFHSLMIAPNSRAGFYWYNIEEVHQTTSPFIDKNSCHILRDTRTNKNLTAEKAFNCQPNMLSMPDYKNWGKGQLHNMGALYASIWWEIYNHENISRKDIATLFTEHLPLVSRDDTFRTVAFKIINKAKELFDGPKGDHYARIISQEFTRRGLSPLTKVAG